ncbi:GNAT family N-acetyltransferase [Paenibacillus sp. HN-1]|uniref:GNAT family N-acetyltransferase n=1 Tax=Paenibacillus TaxID=44249 RepID=UPI001CA8D60B|nr:MULTISPECIES: GNAT family N-acetyltransferase [Paenibacillus]MBY9078080.1 GNAT family N-acetyltransferase [Paenibacillus sp. CGMCC 1.18879]MBY9083821.1 GNAT family N-acetyltransferase [Paenibacillus sinensis]
MSNGVRFTVFKGAIPSQFAEWTPVELSSAGGKLPSTVLAVGAYHLGVPAGLAAAAISGNGAPKARLLGVAVAPSLRRQGVGGRLIAELERRLRTVGISSLSAEYLEDLSARSEQADFLLACGFSEPHAGIHAASGPLHLAKQLPWVGSLVLPRSFSIQPFHTLTLEERELLRSGEDNWYPSILNPLAGESGIDAQRSLVVRRKGQLAGWLTVEAFSQDTLLFKTMFVRAEHQRLGRGVALLAEMLRRAADDSSFREGMFFVEAANSPMMTFLERHVYPLGLRREVLWRTVKPI